MKRYNYKGSCRCGQITFSLGGSARYINNCHCRDCQKTSGAPFMTWALFRRQYFEVKGDVSIYSQGSEFERGFCQNCGSPIFWRSKKLPKWIDIAAVMLDEKDELKPQAETWLSSAITWAPIDPTLVHHSKGPND